MSEKSRILLLGTGYAWEIIEFSLSSEAEQFLCIEYDKDVYRIADSKIGIEPELLDNPLASEE